MSKLEDIQSQKSYKYLQEVEELAQDILTAKDEKLTLANTQNKLREALSNLQHVEDRRTWIKTGMVFIERPTEECKTILRKELEGVETDLDYKHKSLKKMLEKMRDLEHESRLEGFSLKPMSLAEAKALHKGFGLL